MKMNPEWLKMSPNEFKDFTRGISSDMSPEAIERRFKILAELYEGWQFIREFKIVGSDTQIKAQVAEKLDEIAP